MKASDFIADFLAKKGVKSIFELSGGMITHMLDSIGQRTQIQIISMHHEQSAAFAADACGRVLGIPGVALATSGPGATNLLTGIASCYFDSSPAVFITGQVNRHEQKGDRSIRQLGFQETDIVAMAKPITKACFQINEPQDIPSVFEEAFNLAISGRPGPVLIDIPMDVQRAHIDTLEISALVTKLSKLQYGPYQELIDAIKSSKKPLVLAGRGIRASSSQSEFENFISHTNIPVITTLLGLDVIEYDNEFRIGFIGSYGNRWANLAFGECDLLIVLGSRLDIRQTGADTKFIEKRTIFHIDCELCEINNRIKGCIALNINLNSFFSQFSQYAKELTFEKQASWLTSIETMRRKWPDINELKPKGINPNIFIHQLSSVSKNAVAYVADVGSHQMWAAQSVELSKGQLFLTSGGMGAMGFSIPAAIGASISLNKKPVVVIIGDGCMQLNIQELQTIVRNKLPVKIIVMNNQTLGMIRQFQDSYFESRYQSTYWGYDAPDFEKVASAYTIKAKTIIKSHEIEEAVKWLWNDENYHQPLVLQVMIDSHTNTYPKIAFGKPLTEMEPFSKPIEMEGT